jgi:hypothetical protein
MVLADPLTPTMQVELVLDLMTRHLRVPHKPEMGFKSDFGKSTNQPINATGKAPGAGIGVRSFKGKDMKLHGGFLSCLARERIDSGMEPWRSSYGDIALHPKGVLYGISEMLFLKLSRCSEIWQDRSKLARVCS